MGFPQIPLFWFDLANLALAREWQGSRSGTLTRARVLPLPLRPALTFPCGPWRPAGTSSRPRECGLPAFTSSVAWWWPWRLIYA